MGGVAARARSCDPAGRVKRRSAQRSSWGAGPRSRRTCAPVKPALRCHACAFSCLRCRGSTPTPTSCPMSPKPSTNKASRSPTAHGSSPQMTRRPRISSSPSDATPTTSPPTTSPNGSHPYSPRLHRLDGSHPPLRRTPRPPTRPPSHDDTTTDLNRRRYVWGAEVAPSR